MHIKSNSTIDFFTLATLLLCAQLVFFSKFCVAQVGIAWNPSYAAPNYPSYGNGIPRLQMARGIGGVDERVCPLEFDVNDPNDLQRSVLYDYFNVNRSAVYSADGVSGWDTRCIKNPVQAIRRERQLRANVNSRLGSGQIWVDPFPKRIYGPGDGTSLSASPATDKKSGTAAPTGNRPSQPSSSLVRPQPSAIVTPQIEGPTNFDDWTNENQPEPNHDEPSVEILPPPEEYEDAAPEIEPLEWDESLLDELPELNLGFPKGNPLPPTSKELDGFGRVQRRPQQPIAVQGNAQRQQPSTVRTASRPTAPTNALQAAIQLQTQQQARQAPVNPLNAAIAIEAQQKRANLRQ